MVIVVKVLSNRLVVVEKRLTIVEPDDFFVQCKMNISLFLHWRFWIV